MLIHKKNSEKIKTYVILQKKSKFIWEIDLVIIARVHPIHQWEERIWLSIAARCEIAHRSECLDWPSMCKHCQLLRKQINTQQMVI